MCLIPGSYNASGSPSGHATLRTANRGACVSARQAANALGAYGNFYDVKTKPHGASHIVSIITVRIIFYFCSFYV